MDNLLDFIHIHENVLEHEVCNSLINLFESVQDKHERIDNDGKPNFTQFNLTKNLDLGKEFATIHNYLIENILNHIDGYYEFVDGRVFPEQYMLEQMRIKKYLPNQIDMFDTHVDVINHETSKRFLSFTFYLNDVDEGGETVFKDIVIKPKQGSLLIFPPLWMFPHRGECPISNEKYILTTYLHYQ